MVQEKFKAPTLWGTTSFIADELTWVNGEVATLMDDIGSLKSSIGIVMDHIEKSGDAKTATDKLVKIVSIMIGQIQALTPEIQTMRSSDLKIVELMVNSIPASKIMGNPGLVGNLAGDVMSNRSR